MNEDDLTGLFPVVGLVIGACIGTLANIIPFGFTLLTLLYMFLCFWKGVSIVSFSLMGMAWFAVFGAMAQVIPYDFIVLIFLGVFMVQLLDNVSSRFEPPDPTLIFLMPLILIVIGDVAYLPSPDFANAAGGFATGWNGCVSTCSFGSIAFLFTNGLFGPLVSGNLYQFITNLFTNTTGFTNLFLIGLGFVLVLLGMGIGGTISVLVANFGININDAGARLSQAFGFAMVLYGAINLTFGGWIPGLFPGTLALGILLEALFPAVCFYGAYLRATVIDN